MYISIAYSNKSEQHSGCWGFSVQIPLPALDRHTWCCVWKSKVTQKDQTFDHTRTKSTLKASYLRAGTGPESVERHGRTGRCTWRSEGQITDDLGVICPSWLVQNRFPENIPLAVIGVVRVCCEVDEGMESSTQVQVGSGRYSSIQFLGSQVVFLVVLEL